MSKIEGSYCDFSQHFYLQDNPLQRKEGIIICSRTTDKSKAFLTKLLQTKMPQYMHEKFTSLGYTFIGNSLFLEKCAFNDGSLASKLILQEDQVKELNSGVIPLQGVLWYEEGDDDISQDINLFLQWCGWYLFAKDFLFSPLQAKEQFLATTELSLPK